MTEDADRGINFDAIVRLPAGVRLKRDEARDRHVLLAPERALVMDPIGIAILGEVDGVKSVRQVVQALAQTYAADPAVIGKDVSAFLTELADRRMLETVP
jgi:pyrroloquinoline quinone biosynthesis protein D